MESNSTESVNPSDKEVEGDNLDAIKKFIEDQEKEFNDQESNKDKDSNESSTEVPKKEVDVSKDFDDRLEVASSMMDMILSESEEKIACRKKNDNESSKQIISSSEKGSTSMALSVGSHVEAKDFCELWHPAHIVEVDYEEMEVLVHYDNSLKKHDEWINVSSPRLRPISISAASAQVSKESNICMPSETSAQSPSVPKDSSEPSTSGHAGPSVSAASMTAEEGKGVEDKPKLQFVVGERCLVKWRDNRRFMATVTKDLGDGSFEVAFDDGVQWKCTTARMYKLKDTSKLDPLTVDTTSPSSTSAQSPVLYGTGPSAALPQTPAFHTHLFDPTRDYLGSKSERREMKRKLNIKEIFNIGQKRAKNKDTPRPPVKKPRIIRRKTEQTASPKPKKELPDAVASIIGTQVEVPVVPAPEPIEEIKEEIKPEILDGDSIEDSKSADELLVVPIDVVDPDDEVDKDKTDDEIVEPVNASDTSDSGKTDTDPVQEEEVKLEKFDVVDVKHEEVLDRMKEVINKLEDGINKAESVPKPEPIEEIKTELKEETLEPVKEKKVSKIKKGKKLRLLQDKKVNKQVAKVKNELEVMKRQFEEMRQQMAKSAQKSEPMPNGRQEMPESFLLPGEWCCRWINGQPVGKVIELEGEVRDVNSKPGLPRRSVQVEDKRLPPGWTKHMVRRSLGHSAGKWDVVLVNPECRRFHTRTDMRHFLESPAGASLRDHEHVLMDFGVHMKLARRMGWATTTPDGEVETPVVHLPAGTLYSTSPLIKRKKLSLKRQLKDEKKLNRVLKEGKKKKRKLAITIKLPKYLVKDSANVEEQLGGTETTSEPALEAPPLEDGYVWVGSLKVQIIENLLRCPAEGCFKNFRNNTLLQMHIKHYHRELRKMLGRTPKVLDLAYARTMPVGKKQPKKRERNLKTFKVKLPKLPKRIEEPKLEVIEEENQDLLIDIPRTPEKSEEPLPKVLDSPKLRKALVTKKRPRVLLPVRKPDLEVDSEAEQEVKSETIINFPTEQLDFETAISTHTVTKPFDVRKLKKGKVATLPPRSVSEEDDVYSMTSDFETRSSFPRSGTPDSKGMETKMQPVSSESNEEQKDANAYLMTETGERIKIVHMKREEIINCHCGFREEDGLMVQCELCLCWQHALCHNIQKESEVPEKYTCSICLNPRRGRRSRRFLHDQDRLYEGLLPGARPCESLRRSHELSGNLHRIQDALHALTVKYYVATKKHHPKLYLWAKDWESAELTLTQEKLNSDYSDLSVMISGVGKENLPVKDEMGLHSPSDEHDRYSQRDQLATPTLLSGLLSSPGASLDLPISSSELEKLVKTVQAEEAQRVHIPVPEAAIENGACRERLLRHVTRCQAVIDARLDSIEAQVAELESQDPSFEDDETADYFPRTKQTIQMLMRDLDTMEELGVIT